MHALVHIARIVHPRAETGVRFQLRAVWQVDRVRRDVIDGGVAIVASVAGRSEADDAVFR